MTGATGGIGGAIARTLHARGAHVVLTGRREDLLEKLRATLGERAELVPGDLAEEDGPARLAAAAGDVVNMARAMLSPSSRRSKRLPSGGNS